MSCKKPESRMTASSIGIGNLNTEPVEWNSSALNLHNRIQVDPLSKNGNDIYVAPNGDPNRKWSIWVHIIWGFFLS